MQGMGTQHHATFYMGSGDLNLDPHICTATGLSYYILLHPTPTGALVCIFILQALVFCLMDICMRVSDVLDMESQQPLGSGN